MNQLKNEEICVCNTLFKFSLVPTREDKFDLIVVPCLTPTAVYDVARIETKRNTCTQLTYFQAEVNGTCVEIIQDCDLENIIRRCIMTFIEDLPCIECHNPCRCFRNRNRF